MREYLFIGVLTVGVAAGALGGAVLAAPIETREYLENQAASVNTVFPVWGVLVGVDSEERTLTVATTLPYSSTERRTLRFSFDRATLLQNRGGAKPAEALALRETHLGKSVFVTAVRESDGRLRASSITAPQQENH